MHEETRWRLMWLAMAAGWWRRRWWRSYCGCACVVLVLCFSGCCCCCCLVLFSSCVFVVVAVATASLVLQASCLLLCYCLGRHGGREACDRWCCCRYGLCWSLPFDHREDMLVQLLLLLCECVAGEKCRQSSPCTCTEVSGATMLANDVSFGGLQECARESGIVFTMSLHMVLC